MGFYINREELAEILKRSFEYIEEIAKYDGMDLDMSEPKKDPVVVQFAKNQCCSQILAGFSIANQMGFDILPALSDHLDQLEQKLDLKKKQQTRQ